MHIIAPGIQQMLAEGTNIMRSTSKTSILKGAGGIKATKHGPVNQVPDCLFLDFNHETKRDRRLVLKFTIHFNEAMVEHRLADIGVSLTGGDLRLKLEHVDFIKHTKFSPFILQVAKRSSRSAAATDKHSSERVKKPSLTAELGLSDAKAGWSSAAEAKTSRSKDATLQDLSEANYATFQMNALGGPLPGWRFGLQTADKCLVGSMIDEAFCECRLSGAKGRIEAEFVVHQRFIRMEFVSGSFVSKGVYDLASPKKMKVFNLWLWKNLVHPLFQPRLSWVAVDYE